MKPKRHHDPEHAKARREQVLNAAAECVRRRGYHGAAMAEVARTAGMSPGHIYNYFAGKEEIIEALVARDVEEMFSMLGEMQARGGELIDAMIDGVDYGVDKNLDPDRAALELEMLAEGARNPKVAAILREADQRARARFREMLTGPRGSLRGLDAREIDARIEVVGAIFNGLLACGLMNPALDRDAVLSVLRPTLRRLFTP